MNQNTVRHSLILLVSLLAATPTAAQFVDHFDGDSLHLDPRAANGWTYFTGDGSAVMDFRRSGQGHASITVDATKDARGIWWALIFHSHLMEFDIPDTSHWHTISMTTHGFDAVPGDSVYGQLALMDWGLAKYRVDLDYFKVDLVNADSAGPDKGVQVPYHPIAAKPETFSHHQPVAEDCTIDREFPDLQFNDWTGTDQTGNAILLSVSGTQFAILRWDLAPFSGKKAAGSGLLELTTYALQRLPGDTKDFGMVRIVEIIGGKREWRQQDISYDRLCGGTPLDLVLNGQMIIDVNVAQYRGGRTFATIPRPVLQRMIDGTTHGLAIRPLGAVHASFYAMENRGGKRSATLHFSLSPNH